MPYGQVLPYNADWSIVTSHDNPVWWNYYHQGGYLNRLHGHTYGDGLYHFRHRSYDPHSGHWLQRDGSGRPNPREYQGSNPANQSTWLSTIFSPFRYLSQGLHWVSGQLDSAGGWLMANAGWAGNAAALVTSWNSGLFDLAGGAVGLLDWPTVWDNTQASYSAYRKMGFSWFESGFYSTPILGGIGRMGSEIVTGQSYAEWPILSSRITIAQMSH